MRKPRGRRDWVCEGVILVAVLACGGGPVRAAPVATGAPPDVAAAGQAQQAIELARQAEAAGRVEEAIAQLERAYEVGGDHELLFRLGELTSRVGQNVRALRLYRAYRMRDPDGTNRAVAEYRIAVLEGRAPAFETAREPVPSAPLASPPTSGPAAGLVAVGAPGPSPPLPRWVPWAGLAATVGLAIAATLSGVSASDSYDQLRTSCGATSAGCAQGQIDDVRSSANRTTILWVAAGVFAAATGAGFYVNTREAGFSGAWRF